MTIERACGFGFDFTILNPDLSPAVITGWSIVMKIGTLPDNRDPNYVLLYTISTGNGQITLPGGGRDGVGRVAVVPGSTDFPWDSGYYDIVAGPTDIKILKGPINCDPSISVP